MDVRACEGVRGERDKMWAEVKRVVDVYLWRRLVAMGEGQRVDWLLESETGEGGWKWGRLYVVVMKGINAMFGARGRTGVVDRGRDVWLGVG